MKHSPPNRLPLPALLRNANRINTPVKNSLCCAAAGITKSFRATAGGLVPHVKLREAAHLDAPLNAKNRPPAQLVVGYTHQANPIAPVSTADIQTVGL